MQAILAAMKEEPSFPLTLLKPEDIQEKMTKRERELQAYAAALKRDLLAVIRSIVAACRASGQRRQELQSIIQQGNASGTFNEHMFWRDKEGELLKLIPELQLLRDCETRWSSIFLMIERLLILYPVSSQPDLTPLSKA